MVCLDRFSIIPLVFACVCQFFSACNVSGSDAKDLQSCLSSEPQTVQVSEKVKPVQESEKAKTVQEAEKTKPVQAKKPEPVWVGNVNTEDPLGSAADIYYGSPSNPAGVFEYQGLVFCIVDIPLSGELDDDSFYEMEGMLEEKKQLQNHYDLSAISRLNRRVLENQMGDASYRYATAYKLKDIQALQAAGKNTPAEMAKENEKENKKENEKKEQ